MRIDAKLAGEIADRIAKASSLCEFSLRAVKTNERLGQVEVYGRLVGNFMGRSFTNVLGPIWKAFPALEPAAMRVRFVHPEPTLTAESREAIAEFLREAHATLAFAKAAAPASQSDELFAFGGLAELEDAVSAIETFLAHPRFRDSEVKS